MLYLHQDYPNCVQRLTYLIILQRSPKNIQREDMDMVSSGSYRSIMGLIPLNQSPYSMPDPMS